MSQNISIAVHHVTRIEGHGNILINVREGKIEECTWQIVETPRFFESMVRGRHYSEVARITSRICGICSIGHTLASVAATEDALGMQLGEQALLLRNLLKHAENFDSHCLHVYFLAAPDLLNVPSVIPVAQQSPEVVKRALDLKRLAHQWGAMIGGRTTHPTRVIPGGFSKWPSDEEIQGIRGKLQENLPELEKTLEFLVELKDKLPHFERPSENVSLTSPKEYALLSGKIKTRLPSGETEILELADYKKVTNEYISPNSTAKFTKHRLDSYCTNALSRLNNNYEQLHPKAKEAAEQLGLKPPLVNPFYNTLAQAVEMVHSYHSALEMFEQLAEKGIQPEPLAQPTRFGRGFGAVEVPRGVLFHEYAYDDEGMCTDANCVIPTNQNHANIQKDMETLLPVLLEQDQDKPAIRKTMEMLVRAYDPCVSCSTHYLDVRFKD